MMAFMRISILIYITLLTGCGILELKIDVIQRVIVDKGDNTKDNFRKLNSKLEEGPITESADQHTSTQHHVSSSSNDKTESKSNVETDIETKLY